MTKVLLPDDDRLFLTLESSFLRRAGCRAFPTGPDDDVLDLARQHRPDLVLLDARPPHTAAQDSCRALKAEPELDPIPVLVLCEADSRESCLAAEADAVVVEPFEAESLLDEIARLLPATGRAGNRVPVVLDVEYRHGDAGGTGRTKDVGEGGMFLKTAESLQCGDPLGLEFTLPGERPAEIRTAGTVVREVAADRDSHLLAGYGVRFDDPDDASRRALADFVAERRR